MHMQLIKAVFNFFLVLLCHHLATALLVKTFSKNSLSTVGSHCRTWWQQKSTTQRDLFSSKPE